MTIFCFVFASPVFHLLMLILRLLLFVFDSVLVFFFVFCLFRLFFRFGLILLPLSVRMFLKYSLCCIGQWNLRIWLWLSTLPTLFLSPVQFFFYWGGGGGGMPDVGVMSGGVIINIRSCRETKGLKWKGLAGWGDLAMSCTSVIFLVRLELSQGFNWNPDFKETLGPSSSSPSQLHPCTNSPGWIHSRPQHIHTDRDHYNIRESITMHDPGWNWLCSNLHKIFRCGVCSYVWICVVLVCVWIRTAQFFLHFKSHIFFWSVCLSINKICTFLNCLGLITPRWNI